MKPRTDSVWNVKTNIICPRCGQSHIKKNGTTRQGKQRYRCKACGRQFLFCLDYTYRACNPFYRELIVPMTLNGSGVRDIARVLQVSPTTVLAVLKEVAAQIPEPRVPTRILALEADEQWSFVQNKGQQCWLWNGMNRHTGYIPAFVLGRRTDANCRKLSRKLACCDVRHFATDDGRVPEVMVREHEPSNRLCLGCEDQRDNLSEVWPKPHQKEWHNLSGQATLSLQSVQQAVLVLLGLHLPRL